MVMKYVVTGGAGFIGSNLCRRLLEEDHNVACLDDLSTGKYRNIESLEKNQAFEFFNHDLTKPFFPDKIDAIFNLACPASPAPSWPSSRPATTPSSLTASTAARTSSSSSLPSTGASSTRSSTRPIPTSTPRPSSPTQRCAAVLGTHA